MEFGHKRVGLVKRWFRGSVKGVSRKTGTLL